MDLCHGSKDDSEYVSEDTFRKKLLSKVIAFHRNLEFFIGFSKIQELFSAILV